MTTIDYPLADRIPAPGETIELLPGVHWLRMPLPSSLEHVNLWLLNEGDAWTIVDCGIGTEPLKQLWEHVFVGTLAGCPVRRIVATHMHSDHLGLAHWLCEHLGATLHMSAAEYRFAQRMRGATAEAFGETAAAHLVRHGVTDAALIAQVRAQPSPYPVLAPALPSGFHPIAGGDVLDVGGRGWFAIAGQGHSPEHLAFYCGSLGVLIAGDMLLPRISTYVGVSAMDPDANPLPRFLESIDRFLDLPADTLVLPSHGEPFRGIRTRVGQLHAHHADRLRRVREACASPRSAAELVPMLFPRSLDSRQFSLALGETLSHVRELEERGDLCRWDRGDGVLCFAR